MSTDMKPIPRSMLFTPATKASYFGKAADVDADAVILDLEDSVATAAKDQARRAALNYRGRLARPDRAIAVTLQPRFRGDPQGRVGRRGRPGEIASSTGAQGGSCC